MSSAFLVASFRSSMAQQRIIQDSHKGRGCIIESDDEDWTFWTVRSAFLCVNYNYILPLFLVPIDVWWLTFNEISLVVHDHNILHVLSTAVINCDENKDGLRSRIPLVMHSDQVISVISSYYWKQEFRKIWDVLLVGRPTRNSLLPADCGEFSDVLLAGMCQKRSGIQGWFIEFTNPEQVGTVIRVFYNTKGILCVPEIWITHAKARQCFISDFKFSAQLISTLVVAAIIVFQVCLDFSQ